LSSSATNGRLALLISKVTGWEAGVRTGMGRAGAIGLMIDGAANAMRTLRSGALRAIGC
jgi:hypothetical protein